MTEPAGSGMSRSFSLYLDVLRLMAALVVVASHSVYVTTDWSRWWPNSVGHNAVVVFFLLSGYVIAYVADHKENNARVFWLSRLARIYSVAVPALLITMLADQIGLAIQPGFYARGLTTHDLAGVRLLASLVFANELWLVSIMPFSNSAYWSLCYEMSYYLLFSLWCFGGARRKTWLALAALVIGPKILLLAPVWLLGVVVYRHRGWRALGEPLCWALWLVSIAGIVTYQGLDTGAALSAWTKSVVGDWLYLRLHFSKHFVGDYLLAVLIAANFVGFRGIAHRFAPLLDLLAVPIRTSASLTFSIYLFHLPLVLLMALLLGGLPLGASKLALVAGLSVSVCAVLGFITERRKDDLRRWLARQRPFISQAVPAR